MITGCGGAPRDADEATATTLSARLDELGVAVSPDVAADLFGTDGGHLCAAADDPGALPNVALVGHRFALRKTAVDTDDVAVARAVIETYCPQHLEAFTRYTDGLATREGDDG